jgi:hypothetical protein
MKKHEHKESVGQFEVNHTTYGTPRMRRARTNKNKIENKIMEPGASGSLL